MRRRAVVLRGFVYFVGTHTRSTVPLGRSAAALGAILEGPQILIPWHGIRVGKGLRSKLREAFAASRSTAIVTAAAPRPLPHVYVYSSSRTQGSSRQES